MRPFLSTSSVSLMERTSRTLRVRPKIRGPAHGITSLRSHYRTLEKKYRESKLQGAQPQKPAVVFSQAVIKRAKQLSATANLFEVFPDLMDRLDYITDKWRAQALLVIIGLTLLEKERFVCLHGDTGDGKTYAAQHILNFIDCERNLGRVKALLDDSREWIKYAGGPDGKALKNKLLFMDEKNPAEQGKDDRWQELIRQLDNDMSPVAEFEIIDRIDGNQLGIRGLRLEKPIYIVITSITPPHRWDAQNRSRFIFIEFNLTPEQVHRAMERLANKDPMFQANEEIYWPFNKFLSELKRHDPANPDAFYAIEIPFLHRLIAKDPDATGADLRRFKLLEAFIQASAILHQRHREKKQQNGKNILIADWQDYLNAKTIFENAVPRMTQPGGTKHLQTFRKIALHLYLKGPQDRYTLATECKLTKRERDGRLNDLVEIRLLKRVKPSYSPDQKAWYALGDQFCQMIDDELDRQRIDPEHFRSKLGAPLPPKEYVSMFDQVVEQAIAQVEAVNSLTLPTSPADTLGEPESTLNEDLTSVSHSPTGEEEETNFSPPTPSMTDVLAS